MRNNRSKKTNNTISRRTFINRTAAGTAGLAVVSVPGILAEEMLQQGKWPAGASKTKFHMIGHAHIDPVWLWPWQEGVSVVHSTFRAALDRMNETPDFTFVASSSQFYQWVAENDPAMLQEIRKRVEEGRWCIVGGWWVEPDVNLPNGEALIRQGLYGQLTLERLLGRRASVAFNPDSFGHPGTLPQILRSQGMDKYIFMRPAPHEKTLPADLFWWEGPDGSKVLTYRIQISYNDRGSVRQRIENILEQCKDQPMKSFMAYYGAGDHGGGATKENIGSIEELKREKGAPAVMFSTPEKYFEEILADKKLTLPVVTDDLQHHAVGCYTAEWELKKNNRQAEAILMTAEKIAAVGNKVWGANYPREALTQSWHKVLFLQFHDSLAGTSLPEHSQAAREGFGYAMDIARNSIYMNVQKLEWQIPTEDEKSEYMVAFNPHAWDVQSNIEYDFFRRVAPDSSRVEDETGQSLLHQWAPGETETSSRKKLIVQTSLPAFGYRQIRLMEGQPAGKSSIKAGGNELENEFLRVRFSPDGLVGILDKESGHEVFTGGATGCRAVVIDDPSDTWSHNVRSYSNEEGSFGKAVIKVLEKGPVRGIIRTHSRYGSSDIAIDWILYSGSKQLEAKVRLNWHERLKMLKFSFPVNIETPVATYETPYGFITRAVNGDEDPGQRWLDVSGNHNDRDCGFTLINDAKYGYSVSGNDMRVSVVRSAVFAHHDPKVLSEDAEYQWMDQGIQTFRMLLVPHRNSWKESNIIRLAEEFISPPVLIYQGIHGGSLPKADSFLAVDIPNVLISSVKKAEHGDDLILRCVELSGKAVEATIDLRFARKKWKGDFSPFEIKTLKMNDKTGDIKEVNVLEE